MPWSIACLGQRLTPSGRCCLPTWPWHPAQPWLELVRAGDFSSLPRTLDWESSCDLAHLIDGYALVEAVGKRPVVDRAMPQNYGRACSSSIAAGALPVLSNRMMGSGNCSIDSYVS